MAGEPSLTKFLPSAFASESMVKFCFAFIFVPLHGRYLGIRCLGLKVDVPSFRHLPCVPAPEHTYILALTENVPSVFTTFVG